MPKKEISIPQEVMKKIITGQIKMKPKWYFILGSLLAFIGLAASFIISVFLVTLIRFSIRTHGPMGEYRWNQLLSSFPWWAAILAVIGIVSGVILLRRYDFSYKKNFWLVLTGFVTAVIVSGWLIDFSGLDNIWFRQGPMRGIMRQYMQKGGNWQRDGMMRQNSNRYWMK